MPKAPWICLVLAAVTAAATTLLGDSYLARLNAPRGLALSSVDDHLESEPPPRPRRTIVILADGLRADTATAIAATARLKAAGQCRLTDVGQPSLSRPIYTSLSSGVEPARSGVRDNDFLGAAPVESIWEVARAAGLKVFARSELRWFKELFPEGFDRYDIVTRGANYFMPSPLGDLTLIHPLFVDETAHDFGAGSPEYAAAVRRLSHDADGLFAHLDLHQDLVVLTSDHGHTKRGGHGGAAAEVQTVLTCLAGPGVAHRDDGGPIATVDVTAALAVLLGVPFPKNLGGGDPAVLDTFIDPAAFPASYLDDRHAALQRLHAVAADTKLKAAAGGQTIRLALVLGLLGCFIAAAMIRRRSAAPLLTLAIVVGATLAAHFLWLGSLDLSAVNKRGAYIIQAIVICLGPALLVLGARGKMSGLGRALADQALVTLVALVVAAGHPLVFGVQVGYPLPSPFLLFLPFLATFFGLVHAGLLAALAVWALASQRGRAGGSSQP